MLLTGASMPLELAAAASTSERVAEAHAAEESRIAAVHQLSELR